MIEATHIHKQLIHVGLHRTTIEECTEQRMRVGFTCQDRMFQCVLGGVDTLIDVHLEGERAYMIETHAQKKVHSRI